MIGENISNKVSNFLKQGIINRIRFYLSRYSYGIFLTHVIIVDIFINMGLLKITENAIIWIPLLTFTCLIVDVGVLFILDQIPLIHKFSGSH